MCDPLPGLRDGGRQLLRLHVVRDAGALARGLPINAEKTFRETGIVAAEGGGQPHGVCQHLIPDGVAVVGIELPADKVRQLMVGPDGQRLVEPFLTAEADVLGRDRAVVPGAQKEKGVEIIRLVCREAFELRGPVLTARGQPGVTMPMDFLPADEPADGACPDGGQDLYRLAAVGQSAKRVLKVLPFRQIQRVDRAGGGVETAQTILGGADEGGLTENRLAPEHRVFVLRCGPHIGLNGER